MGLFEVLFNLLFTFFTLALPTLLTFKKLVKLVKLQVNSIL